MLDANCYTTEELIHYAGIDDRFKPMLADRIAREGLPECDDCPELEEEILNESAQFTRETKLDWLSTLDTVLSVLEAHQDDFSEVFKLLEELHDDIDSHETA